MFFYVILDHILLRVLTVLYILDPLNQVHYCPIVIAACQMLFLALTLALPLRFNYLSQLFLKFIYPPMGAVDLDSPSLIQFKALVNLLDKITHFAPFSRDILLFTAVIIDYHLGCTTLRQFTI